VNHASVTPFDSIESAQEYVRLLAKAVTEAKKELEADVEKALSADVPRRLQVLRMALYDLEKLQLHMNTSDHILDELRSLHPMVAGGHKAERMTAS
jgi:NADH:ubiquinone oxidoreductase subunit D